MNREIEHRLQLLRADFEQQTGKAFKHFYCPILHVDEPADLQQGHVINRSIEGSPGTWVVQRQDVDRFYGAKFEADFEFIQFVDDIKKTDSIAHKKIRKHLKPRILFENKEVRYYVYFPNRRDRPRPGWSVVPIESRHGTVQICVDIRQDQVESFLSKWIVATHKDFRLAALVSLIKAAHLSMFQMFGYTYALTTAGRFVGKDILGTFFLENQTYSARKPVIHNALTFFHQFRHMVRPLTPNTSDMLGTLSDGRVALCASSSASHPWALTIFVKTGSRTSAVLLPAPGEADAIVTFLDFLKNENETIRVHTGYFDRPQGRWVVQGQTKPLTWDKSEGSFPTTVADEEWE